MRLPVARRTGGLPLVAHGISVLRVLANIRFVPLFNFSQGDGPAFRDASFLVHFGIEILGIFSFGSSNFGIDGFGSEGLGSLGSESFDNENPRLC